MAGTMNTPCLHMDIYLFMNKNVAAFTCVLAIGACGASSYLVAENYSKPKEVDNTGINKRDQSDATKTPMDQSNANTDVEITRRIRDAVTDDESLSVNAHNVKIITADGKVTLRGPVKDENERLKVVSVARKVAGSTHVQDQLEVAGLSDE